MSLILIGINHQTANLSLRSKVAFDDLKKESLNQFIYQDKNADALLIINTCNRSEIYIQKEKIENKIQWLLEIKQFIIDLHNLEISLEEFEEFSYYKFNVNAVEHLMQVACGLDSLVIGESQILSQLKESYETAQEDSIKYGNRALETSFSKLLQDTFACSKKVRSETDLGKYAISVSYLACSLVRQKLNTTGNILLIGAGKTIALTCKHLENQNIKNITILNRTQEKAKQLIEELKFGKYGSLEQLEESIYEADVVIASTAANTALVKAELIQKLQEKRNYKELLLVDLAVPNDVEVEVREIKGVTLFNLDDLQASVQSNIDKRKLAKEASLEIINDFTQKYQKWRRGYQGSDLIKAYRDNLESLRTSVTDMYLDKIKKGADPQEILQEFSIALTNKIIHTPTSLISEFIKLGDICGLDIFAESLSKEEQNIKSVIRSLREKDDFKLNGGCCRNVVLKDNEKEKVEEKFISKKVKKQVITDLSHFGNNASISHSSFYNSTMCSENANNMAKNINKKDVNNKNVIQKTYVNEEQKEEKFENKAEKKIADTEPGKCPFAHLYQEQ